MDAAKIVSGGAAGAGIGPAAVYLASRFGAHLTSEDGALIAGTAIAVFAFLAHNGISGVWRLFLHGQGSQPSAPAEPATPGSPAA
jgi:hypothetical protein